MTTVLKYQTDLAPGMLFDGTQLTPASTPSASDARFLLENEDEFMIAHGNEVEAVEVEVEEALPVRKGKNP